MARRDLDRSEASRWRVPACVIDPKLHFLRGPQKKQKTSKKYESQLHGEIWLAPRRPGGGTEHARTILNYIFLGVRKKNEKHQKSTNPNYTARFGSLRGVLVAAPSMRVQS